MPTYVVTNPKTGQKVRLTGDEPPTDENLDEIFSSLPAPEVKAGDVPVNSPGEVSEFVPDQPQADEPTLLEKISAGGKAAGVMAGNLIPATIGAIGGAIYGAGSEIVGGAPQGSGQEYVASNAQAFSPFSTDDPLANQYLQNTGNALGQLDPGFVGRAARGATLSSAAAGDASKMARQIVSDTKQTISEIPQSIKSSLSKEDDSARSMGSAEVDAATRRREMAAQLPVDPRLTEGQATRDFNQQRFENEAMKGELGQPLRERAAYQHQAVKQSIDEWIDQTGAQSPDIRSVGIAVDEALRSRSIADKNAIRAAYQRAEESGELREPITTEEIVNTINNSRSAESTAPVLVGAKKEILRLGGAEELEDGTLVPRDMTLGNAEQLRKFVNKTTGYDPTNVKFAADIKSAIDATTRDRGGDMYRSARRLREKYSRKYEDHAVISDLMGTKKGSADRKVALEDVFDRVVFRGSLDDVRTTRKTLQTAGDSGTQAWREIQGAGLKYIRDEATKNVARDINGNEMISPAALNRAITRLDVDGKLDFIYGKNGAEQLRTLNDISKDLFTSPPGAINHSNTASVLTAALDMMISGSAGVPLPVSTGIRMATSKIKDRKVRNRINKALEDAQTKN